jgi:hypothetical protein
MTDAFDLRDIILSKRVSNRKFEGNRKVIKAHTVGVDNPSTPEVSGRPSYVWAREWGMNGGVFQVFNAKVQNRVDLPVLVAYSPKEPYMREIIDVDWAMITSMADYDGEKFQPNHHLDHEWPDFAPGPDAVSIFPRAIAPLRVYPGSGLTVGIAPHLYEIDNTFVEYLGTSSFDISNHQPASGKAVRVLIYLDKEANQPRSIAGDEVTDSIIVIPPAPDVPEDVIPSALVRLDGDQTDIGETDIRDVRKILASSTKITLTQQATDAIARAQAELDLIITKHVLGG